MAVPELNNPLKPEFKQTVLWLGIALAVFWLLAQLAPILTPFVFAAILAYILHPGVQWLERRRVPKSVATAMLIGLLILVVTLFVLLVIAVLQREIPLLREQIPALLGKLNAVLAPKLNELGIKVRFDFASLSKLLTEHLTANPEDVANKIFHGLLSSSGAALAFVGNAVLIPLVLFYLLMDWNNLLTRIDGALPRRWVEKVRELANETDDLLSQYLRGQILVMLVLAAYYSIALLIARFDVAIPVGIFTGLAIVIPYVGYGIGLLLALLAATLQFGDWYGFIAVAIIYGVGQVLESFFLTPRLVGERIGLHPLAVLFALLAFGQLFGFFGVLLALPASAVLLVALRQLRGLYLNSALYQRQ